MWAGGRPAAGQRDHAILAALNIASELFHLKRQSSQRTRSLDASMGSLVALIDEAVNVTKAEHMRDMGKVMGIIKSKAQGRADMTIVSIKVKERLNT